MKSLSLICLALFVGCSSTTPPAAPLASPASAAIGAITWDFNPPIQQISAYRVYRIVGKSGALQATVSGPPYRPGKKGSYYITAIGWLNKESPPSKTVNL